MTSPLRRPNLQKIINSLSRQLPEIDNGKNYSDLETAFYKATEFSAVVYKRRVAEIFASPIYDDACKRYFAATHVSYAIVLLLGGEFLTEEIILGYIEDQTGRWFDQSKAYIEAIMGSSHLSENIIEAAFERFNKPCQAHILELTPDNMITPRVINAWSAWQSTVLYGSDPFWQETYQKAVISRIKQAHPEYEGFPDEWVLKVFCGE